MAFYYKKGYLKVRGKYNPPPVESEPDYGMFGYAKAGNTTGGGSGAVDIIVIPEGNTASMNSQLFSGSNANNPKIVVLEGGLPYDTPANKDPRINYMIEPGNNKTLVGMPGAYIKNGSFRVKNGFGNIIVRNIEMGGMLPAQVNADGTFPVDSDGEIYQSDHLVLLNGGKKIWFDHIKHNNSEFTDGYFDSSGGSDFVTVSFCDYPRQDKMSLLGGSSTTTTYNGIGRYTWAFNRLTNVYERGPSFANGFIHHFNNYSIHTESVPSYAVQLQLINKSQAYSEKNYFKDLIGKAIHITNYSTGMPYAGLVEVGNIYDNVQLANSVANNTGTTFNPYAAYDLGSMVKAAADVPTFLNPRVGNTLTLEEMGITI